jgi:deazaflavin-dependent oxidoreductase (nitroreductase family)
MDMPRERKANKKYLTPKGKTLAWITRMHLWLYRWTGGLLGKTVFQMSEQGSRFPLRAMKILLLTTTGCKSGLQRTVPLPYFEYDGRIFIVGSFAGGAKHPAWYHNLRDDPKVHTQIGFSKGPAVARTLEGEDREHYWSVFSGDWPRYRIYQESTPRQIPLVEIV